MNTEAFIGSSNPTRRPKALVSLMGSPVMPGFWAPVAFGLGPLILNAGPSEISQDVEKGGFIYPIEK